jgi:hypothetical protein
MDRLTAFKAYDLRGKVPSELNPEMAYKIGKAYVKLLKAETIVVGHDVRKSSEAISDSLINGLTDAGADVTDIGEHRRTSWTDATKSSPSRGRTAAAKTTAGRCSTPLPGAGAATGYGTATRAAAGVSAKIATTGRFPTAAARPERCRRNGSGCQLPTAVHSSRSIA